MKDDKVVATGLTKLEESSLEQFPTATQASEQRNLGNTVKDDAIAASSTASLDFLEVCRQRPIDIGGAKANIRRRDTSGWLLTGSPPEGLAKDLKVGNNDKALQIVRSCLGMAGVARNNSIILETFRHVDVRERFLVAFGVGINI